MGVLHSEEREPLCGYVVGGGGRRGCYGRGETFSTAPRSPVNKHLARVRFGLCHLPAFGSGTPFVFDLIITQSDRVVAQGNNPPWRKPGKK